MKKIMFNDRYGLTQAVLEGRKTMTRRIINGDYEEIKAFHANGGWHFIADTNDGDSVELKPAYKEGEKVAIAQSYHSLNKSGYLAPEWLDHTCEDSAGYENKMFVRAELMPHCIRITDIKVERLQDISEDDVYKEGFSKESVNNGRGNAAWHWEAMLIYYDGLGRTREIRSRKPKEAFSFLIDHINGNGTWERNPWVFAYEFELIKN